MTDSGNSSSKPKKRRWLALLRPKVAIPLVLIVLVLLSPLLIRGWNLSRIPDLGGPYSGEQLPPPELEASENAWVNYQRARELRFRPSAEESVRLLVAKKYVFRSFWSSSNWIRIWKRRLEDSAIPSDVGAPEEYRLLNHYFEQNQPALEEWKTGTAKPQYYAADRSLQPQRSIRWAESEDEESDPYLIYELGILKAGQLAFQGRHRKALEWMLAVYRYSRHFTQSGGTANWERAIAISRDLFRNLDELLDDEGFTHDELITFLHDLEESYKLTGTLERAQLDDYFTLKRRLIQAYEKGENYREELAHSLEHPGLRVVPASKSNFELFLEGEPQLSIRVMQHHFESLRRNLDKPVPNRATDAGPPWGSDADGVTLSADRWEEFLSKAGLLDLAVGQRELFTNPFLAEDDAAIFESLRILIAAHAFARRPSDRTPAVTMEDLVADSLGETPRDPYDPALPLILAAGKDGEMGVFTSHSNKYEYLANGGSLETLPENLKYSTLSLIINGYYPPDEPQVDELMFRLPAKK